MKRLILLFMAVTMLCAVLSFNVSAGTDYIIPNPPISLELSSPTVDGDITGTEGWYGPCYMNEDTLNFWRRDRELSMWAELHFAIDREGLYVAAYIKDGVNSYDPEGSTDIPHNQIILSSKESVQEGSFDGDIFSLTVDPLDTMISKGYSAAFDNVPKYNISPCEDGTLHVVKVHVANTEDITDLTGICGTVSENEMKFEMCIPWNIIIEDINSMTFKEVRLDVDDIIMDYSTVRAGVVYEDRYIDPETGEIDIYNRYVTAPEKFYYGDTPGHRPIKVYGIDTLGITLNIFELCQGDGHSWSQWEVTAEPTYFTEGSLWSYCSLCGKIKTKNTPMREYTNSFTDINSNAWYAEGVAYCVKRGYMSGMGNEKFSPRTALTREQCVVILANIMDVDFWEYADIPSGFTDVRKNHWYSGAVSWAVQQGYVKGISADKFGTGLKIQRAAFARLLYFAAQDLGADMTVRADLTKYVDHDKLPDWAYDQISWAVGNKIITSIKDDVLMVSPYTELKRSQCAVMLTQMDKIFE